MSTDILSRDLSNIPADKLIELYMKIENNYSGLLSDLRFPYSDRVSIFTTSNMRDSDKTIKVKNQYFNGILPLSEKSGLISCLFLT